MSPEQRPTPQTIVADLAEIFERRGKEAYLGEDVTMAEHMLQAAGLAERTGQSETVIAAALLHDIGHFVGPNGSFTMQDLEDRHHEDSGARLLEGLFPDRVVECVRHHVAAKRYLCAVMPDYLERLSEASCHSLLLQGGPMDEAEVAAFARNPHLRSILQVRFLDEAGKRQQAAIKPFDHYRPLLERLVAERCGLRQAQET